MGHRLYESSDKLSEDKVAVSPMPGPPLAASSMLAPADDGDDALRNSTTSSLYGPTDESAVLLSSGKAPRSRGLQLSRPPLHRSRSRGSANKASGRDRYSEAYKGGVVDEEGEGDDDNDDDNEGEQGEEREIVSGRASRKTYRRQLHSQDADAA